MVPGPEGLVAIDVNSPQLTEVLDETGVPVPCQAASSAEHRQYQESGWDWEPGQAFAPDKLTPFDVRIRLTGGSKQLLPSSLSHITGYVFALYADDIVEVEVPFDPSAECVCPEVTPGLVFCVDTSHAAVSAAAQIPQNCGACVAI